MEQRGYLDSTCSGPARGWLDLRGRPMIPSGELVAYDMPHVLTRSMNTTTNREHDIELEERNGMIADG